MLPAPRLLLSRSLCIALTSAACALPRAGLAGADAAPSTDALSFVVDGELVARLGIDDLRGSCSVQRVTVEDPYYLRKKTFLACPLAEVLALGFGAVPEPGADVLLRARDGYVKPATGELLGEPGGFLAFADVEHTYDGRPGWEPIDRRQVDPGPFYLVWSQPHQRDAHRYPWPYQLETIERAPFEREFSHTVPRGVAPGSPARRGFAIFKRECIACHAINGEGGAVGPDLNVPQSIVEYRPVEQIKEYVRDPTRFRYTSMPSHPHLSDGDLDALIAYFEAMKVRKHDPRGSALDP